MRNESATTFGWLSRVFGIGTSQPGVAQQLWQQTRQQMLKGGTEKVVYSQNWISDFWVARGQQDYFGSLVSTWDPPEAIDNWPGDGESIVGATNFPGIGTNHTSLQKLMADHATESVTYGSGALDEFLHGEAEIRSHGDPQMVQGEHVRAWLSAAVGNLLMSMLLTPEDGTPALAVAAVDRMQFPLQIELPRIWISDFEDRRLELLYNLQVNPEGRLVIPNIRVGQGERWREHWAWLSVELGADKALSAVRLAARLMRSNSLEVALQYCLNSGNDYLQTVSLAVLRRWLLTLKAMTWLEAALEHTWESSRPQDLCCFAFSALKPEWPRRLLALSHRSADVKPALEKMQLWRSSRCAIDANYVPSWETNTGMMWGLFAAVPAIARIESPRYRDSIWCRRELEITEYLRQHCDFMSRRRLLDVPDHRLRDLDEVSVAWGQKDGLARAGQSTPGAFPPRCSVWSPTPMPEWEVKLLRAAGALRMINVFFSDVALTNGLADRIYTGLDIPVSGPTNNPDGWRPYAEIFRDLHGMVRDEAQRMPIHLPSTYSDADRSVDDALAQRIPDLSTGAPDVRDILVAFEWLRVEWQAMIGENLGDFILLDCQRLNRDLWDSAAELSLFRGLAAIRTAGPLWMLQSAGQDVENWPMVGERPIFTQHVQEQFGWMFQMSMEREKWRPMYANQCGLELSPELLALLNQGSRTAGERPSQ